MSDYFCNIYNFRNLALSRQKQASVQTLSAFNDFGSGNIVCGQSDGSFYGRNFAHKPFIAFGINNRSQRFDQVAPSPEYYDRAG